MIGSIRKQRRSLTPRLALAGLAALIMGSAAQAQFLPPVGAAPPREIVERLRANGYYLVGPLRRRDTVYLADVAGADGGRERLVIDAWSGEILQRFVARPPGWRPGFRGGYVLQGGEFYGPPPLGPPPRQDFLASPRYVYGEPLEERERAPTRPRSHPRAKPKQRPAAAALTRPSEPAQAQPANPANAAPQATAPAAAAKEQAKPGPSAAPAPPPVPAEAAKAAPPASSSAAAVPPAKASQKAKPNDVPVNPLE